MASACLSVYATEVRLIEQLTERARLQHVLTITTTTATTSAWGTTTTTTAPITAHAFQGDKARQLLPRTRSQSPRSRDQTDGQATRAAALEVVKEEEAEANARSRQLNIDSNQSISTKTALMKEL